MKIHIGTSGWSYEHLKDVFYPKKLPKAKWLSYLASIFDTVEINVTFYRQPNQKTFEKWFIQTPNDFLFSIKANRFITHIKRLKDTQGSLDRFYNAILPLKDKIGVILFQLPPSLRFDPEIMEQFLIRIEPTYHTAIEVRNTTFLTGDFYSLINKYNCAFCWSDTGGRYPYKELITADFLYIRLHGSPVLYQSSYTEEFLKNFGQKIKDIGLDTFIYFDNDAGGHAPENALWLKHHIEKS